MSETWEILKRFRFQIPCFLFEMQIPNFIWNNCILGMIAYRLHGFLCPEMWMVRVFPNYLRFVGETEEDW